MRKQPNSRYCFVCGLKNEAGLKASFYEQDNGQIVAHFKSRELHQGYPGRMHGGVIAGILDEVMGRTIKVLDGNIWGITLGLTFSFLQPVPTGVNLKAVGYLVKNSKRYFDCRSGLYLQDGSVAAEASGSYMKASRQDIANFDPDTEEWKVYTDDDSKHLL